MSNVPLYVHVTFLITVLTTFGFIYFSIHHVQTNKSGNLPMIVSTFILIWLFIIAVLALNSFFMDFDSIPPKFLLAIGVPFIAITIVLANGRSREFLMKIPITTLTYVHIIRVPIEIVLWWLFLSGLVPELMTFEGVNYDILSGISAPFVAIFMVGLRSKSRIGAIIWNFIALGLLFNIVIRAILSTPTPLQQFAFESPNVAVFYFPYIWLPAFVVPAVLFFHLVSIIKLFANTEDVR